MDEIIIFDVDCGYGGDHLTVYTDKVMIQHKGIFNFLSMGLQGDKILFYKNITSIQYRKPGDILAGLIQFSIPGGNESRKGLLSGAGDENSVTLNNPNYDYDKIVAYMNNRIKAVNEPRTTVIQPHFNAADEIRKFKQLLDDGIITKDEFERKKQCLLNMDS